MEAFTTIEGPAAPLMLANVDTDVIIRIERLTAGDRAVLGHWAFEALRFLPNGAENPDFVLNQPQFRSAPILLAGQNFGCGSSREGAVWALLGRGVKCVIADSFGDIFFSNCFQNGLLPIRLPEATVVELAGLAEGGAQMTVDLEAQLLRIGPRTIPFDVDTRRKTALLLGLDDIGQTLVQLDAIRDWQARDRARRPWVWEPVEP